MIHDFLSIWEEKYRYIIEFLSYVGPVKKISAHLSLIPFQLALFKETPPKCRQVVSQECRISLILTFNQLGREMTDYGLAF